MTILEEVLARMKGAVAPAGGGTGPPAPAFPPPIPASRLRRADDAARWLWHGYLARGDVTLLSALWKAGKSTLLAHLLAAQAAGGKFCGLETPAARTLYVTEESESRWAVRRDEVGLADNVEFLVRPFRSKPVWPEWFGFLTHLRDVLTRGKFDLLVFDTISNLWPVRDENDAPQVQSAMMPLHGMIGDDAALLLVHHLRKSDGQEATGSRGSGALMAFVDTIVELRRYDAAQRRDRRRVLTGVGRWDETPDELVVELLPGKGYSAHGDRHEVRCRDLGATLDATLPGGPPGLTYSGVVAAWPEDPAPRRESLLAALNVGLDDGRYRREGAGRRGDPHRWWAPNPFPEAPENPFPVPALYRGGTGNGNGTANLAGETVVEDEIPD